MGAILNLTYRAAVTEAMSELAKHAKTIFLGQQVAYDGQVLHATLAGVPMERRLEMPVAENFQVGFSTGLALEGFIPVSIFPRWDFLLIAADQLVNHLDKIPLMGGFRPKVILRTAVGSSFPLNPGPQHTQDHTAAFRRMLQTVAIIDLPKAEDVLFGYRRALNLPQSCLVVEHMSEYNK